MELQKLYEQLLSSLGLKIDMKGLIYKANFDDPKLIEYCTIGNKKLMILPSSYHQLTNDENCLYFHPLGEKYGEEVSELHQWLSNEISSDLSQTLCNLIVDFLKITSTKYITNDLNNKLHVKIEKFITDSGYYEKYLPPPLLEIEQLILSIQKAAKSNNDYLVDFVTLSKKLKEKRPFESVTYIRFNGLTNLVSSLKKNHLTEKNYNCYTYLNLILKFILGDGYHSTYTRISTTRLAPHFQSLILSYIVIADNLNNKIRFANTISHPPRPQIELINISFEKLIQNLNVYKNTVKKINNSIKSMDVIAEFTFDEDKIKWLKTNTRACYWFWLQIYFYNPSPTTNHKFISYSYFKLAPSPVGSKDRYNQIKRFFELIEKERSALEIYLDFKEEYDQLIIDFKTPFSWLKNHSNESREWVIEYFESGILSNDEYTALKESDKKTKDKRKYTIVNYKSYKKLKKTYVSLRCDKSLPLDVLIDSFESVSHATRESLLKQTNNAWRQRKNRQKNSANSQKTAKSKQLDKNPFILTPDHETYENLKLLSEVNERTIDEELRVLVAEGIKRA